jgi:hypothetical protein
MKITIIFVHAAGWPKKSLYMAIGFHCQRK